MIKIENKKYVYINLKINFYKKNLNILKKKKNYFKCFYNIIK